ncbi:MAG TPA: nucleotidyltransferase domain-containing protein [archaeon]|nr:nucleotidyltransferase domain-containing protein [archaeon]
MMEREKHKIVSITELEGIINNVLNNHEEVLLCYLYGSYVSGNRSEFSDIDLGIILDSTFKKHYLYQVDLSLEIEKEFGNKIEIDLCILNNTTSRFLYNIIKNGHNIHSKDNITLHEFEIKVLYDYLEIKPLLDMYDKMTIMDVLKD